jgi:hypothetical protein
LLIADCGLNFSRAKRALECGAIAPLFQASVLIPTLKADLTAALGSAIRNPQFAIDFAITLLS